VTAVKQRQIRPDCGCGGDYNPGERKKETERQAERQRGKGRETEQEGERQGGRERGRGREGGKEGGREKTERDGWGRKREGERKGERRQRETDRQRPSGLQRGFLLQKRQVCCGDNLFRFSQGHLHVGERANPEQEFGRKNVGTPIRWDHLWICGLSTKMSVCNTCPDKKEI
jgi:hypothetical protein